MLFSLKIKPLIFGKKNKLKKFQKNYQKPLLGRKKVSIFAPALRDWGLIKKEIKLGLIRRLSLKR